MTYSRQIVLKNGNTALLRNAEPSDACAVLENFSLCTLMYMGFAGFIPEICGMTTQCSLWLLVGEHDHTGKVMAYNKLWHKKEGFPLHIIRSAAHNANDDQPQQVNALLSAFLKAL